MSEESEHSPPSSDSPTRLKALDALIACCSELNMPYIITGKFKKHNFKIKGCTVVVVGRSFTRWGEDCFEQALSEAVKYMISTYTMFSDLKKVLDEKEQELEQYCEPATFNIVNANP